MFTCPHARLRISACVLFLSFRFQIRISSVVLQSVVLYMSIDIIRDEILESKFASLYDKKLGPLIDSLEHTFTSQMVVANLCCLRLLQES